MLSSASLQNVAFPWASKSQTPSTTAFRINCSSACNRTSESFSNGLCDMDRPALIYIDNRGRQIEGKNVGSGTKVAGGCRFRETRENEESARCDNSPGAVCRSVAASCARSRVHVRNAGILLVHRQQRVFLYHFPIGLTGHGIHRELAQIAPLDKVVERLRRFLLIESVLRDERAERAEIRSQHRFPSLHNGLVVHRNRA